MRKRSESGFSLVELMVALLFTGVLMAGMAGVYRSSISSFQTAGEKLSAGRRSRVAIDMLSDDLHLAGMFVNNLAYKPEVSSANPGFWINPDQAVTLSDGTLRADEIYFWFDQFLPFSGTLITASGGPTDSGASMLEGDNTVDLNSPAMRTRIVETNEASFASMVAPGQVAFIKDQYAPLLIESVTSAPGSTKVSFVFAHEKPGAAGQRPGTVGMPANSDRAGVPVSFIIPNQMVKYSIQAQTVDPSDPTHTVPCLVREQGDYQSGVAGLPVVTSRNILAEDVSGFKVFMSVDGGRTWLRADPATGWAGFQLKLNNALSLGYGRPTYTTVNDPLWFREVPVTVRVDVTTRTSQQRQEYSTNVATRSYKEQVHSLVLKPRHFGLTLK